VYVRVGAIMLSKPGALWLIRQLIVGTRRRRGQRSGPRRLPIQAVGLASPAPGRTASSAALALW